MEWPGQPFAWALLGLSAVAAIAYGVWRNRPNAPIAWWFLGGGVLLFITGDTIYKFWHQIMGQQNIPFPSFIDAIYITMYPVLAVGLLLLARARVPGGDRASLIDALTVTLGVGLLSWIFLIGPNVRAPGGMLVRLTSAAYPLGDVLVLAMLAHLWSAGGFRNTAGRLLAIGAVGTLVSDSLYGLANLHPAWNWSDGNPDRPRLDPLLRLLGRGRPAPVHAGALRTAAGGGTANHLARLGLLAAVSLIAPAVLLVETLAATRSTHRSSPWWPGSCSCWCSCAWPAWSGSGNGPKSREQVLRDIGVGTGGRLRTRGHLPGHHGRAGRTGGRPRRRGGDLAGRDRSRRSADRRRPVG